jgi:uncharacterized membrane protein
METIFSYLIENTLFISLLVGVIYMVTAVITLKFPPKKINDFYGYRTAASKKNQEVWDFSQRYSGIKMFQIGLFLTIISFANIFLKLNEGVALGIGLSLLVATCIYLFFTTEKAIKKNFPNEQ